MVALSISHSDNVKKVHCPICGARICDVKKNEIICLDRKKNENGIIIKCHKCGNKINITVK